MMPGMLVALLTVATPTTPASTDAPLPTSLDVSTVQALVVQHDGRWMPLDTLARDVVHEVTGVKRFRGCDPTIVLLAWTFDAKTWMQQPVVTIPNAELRRELELPADRAAFSFAELASHQRLLSLIDEYKHMPPGRKPDPLESKVSDINSRLVTLQEIFGGQIIRLIPDARQASGAWRTMGPAMTSAPAAETPVREAWTALSKACLANDASAFSAASSRLQSALAALPAAHRPAPELIAAELRYNRLHLFGAAWIVMAIAAGMALLALAIRERFFDVLAILPSVAGFAILTYGLALRWQIAGRIPASNMYESLLFLGWGMGLFAILTPLLFRQRLVPLTAAGMAALSLFLADVLPLDSFVRPIVPVLLDTIWMSIHVPVIMVSYSVLGLGVLVAHVQLIVAAFAPGRRPLIAAIDSLHYWYIHVGSILLTAGIATGSMWAASSWGRYWGWDPKEVWSLVALLGYLTILHTRLSRERLPAWAYLVGAVIALGVFAFIGRRFGPVTPMLVLALAATLAAVCFMVLVHGTFATAVKSILCFWMVIMTYVGVNFVLGIGLHSYGFGTGAVARHMLRLGVADLAVVAVLGVIHLSRRSSTEPAQIQAKLNFPESA